MLWGEDLEECKSLWLRLLGNRNEETEGEFDAVYGVFPSQAIEALNRLTESNTPSFPDYTVFSAVNRAVVEPDTGKVRTFKFIRWARLR